MNLFRSLFSGGTHHLNAAEAQARITDPEPLLIIDVRQLAEFKTGHIAGAKLIPLDKLAQQLGKLPPDTEILCVCRSGSRSQAAVRQMSAAGYRAVNLRGGMLGWEHAGYPVKKGK